MKNNFKKLEIRKKGFTLIEALVGITVLLIAVIGPLYIAFQGASLAILARDQITASFLAQEGIEFVRFRIITNSNMGSVGKDLIATTTIYDLSGCSWQLNSGNYCIVDIFNGLEGQVTNCSVYGGQCPYIKYDETAKRYEYTSGTTTFFRRSIRIQHDDTLPDNEIIEFQIESKVEWGKPHDLRSTVIKEVVRDWRP